MAAASANDDTSDTLSAVEFNKIVSQLTHHFDMKLDGVPIVKFNECCGKPMAETTDGLLVCQTCGIVKKQEDGATPKTNEKSADSKETRDYTGPKEEYKPTQRATLFSLLRARSSETKIKFSHEILGRACDLCQTLQQHAVYRANILFQILCACISAACYEYNNPLKPIEIAKFMGLKRKGFPKGEKRLREAVEAGYISIVQNYNPSVQFLTRYFNMIKLDMKYFQLAKDLLDATFKNKICIDSKLTSRCVGIIWLIILVLKLPYNAGELDTAFSIRKNTFSKIIKTLRKYKRFIRPVFEAHGVQLTDF